MPRGIPNTSRPKTPKTRRKSRRNGFKVGRKLYESLVNASSALVSAYAEGLRNSGSVDWAQIDRAHEYALRAQRQLLRRTRRA